MLVNFYAKLAKNLTKDTMSDKDLMELFLTKNWECPRGLKLIIHPTGDESSYYDFMNQQIHLFPGFKSPLILLHEMGHSVHSMDPMSANYKVMNLMKMDKPFLRDDLVKSEEEAWDWVRSVYPKFTLRDRAVIYSALRTYKGIPGKYVY